jgi:poly-gamma-glutamate capsule biosynthesis protein CapA/YwtB (metallophosphatase superfamily)
MGSDRTSGAGGRNLRRVIIVVATVTLLSYGAGSFAYLAAFRVEREPDMVVLGVSPGLADEAVRLAGAFAAAGEHRRVVVREVAGADLAGPGLARLLREGVIDCALTEDAAGRLGFRHADILAVPFPSARVAVSLAEARALCRYLQDGPSWPSGAAVGPSPWAGLALIDLADRAPDRQLLEVGGVFPTLATVLDGTYPLTSEVCLTLRRPAGLFGLPAGVPGLSRWAQANGPALWELATWATTGDARTAFYGTSSEITLTAVGDVMLGRGVATKIDENGLDYPFGLVAERLRAADIVVGNLEAPLGTTGAMLPGKQIWLRGKPEYAECLKAAGIDIVNLANNHILDFDSPCLLETFAVLDGNRIARCGAGVDAAAARVPAVLEADGLKVAFLGFTEFADPGLFWDFTYQRSFAAAEDTPGCNPLDLAVIAEDIAAARTQADIVVVVYHWGLEDIPYPQAFNPANDLETIARRTIDLGANVVLGTHPHAVQGFEIYKKGLIAYSLGNFVSDQRRDTQKESLILEMQVGPSGVLSVRVTPCRIDGNRPRVLTGPEAGRLLEKIEAISLKWRGLP